MSSFIKGSLDESSSSFRNAPAIYCMKTKTNYTPRGSSVKYYWLKINSSKPCENSNYRLLGAVYYDTQVKKRVFNGCRTPEGRLFIPVDDPSVLVFQSDTKEERHWFTHEKPRNFKPAKEIHSWSSALECSAHSRLSSPVPEEVEYSTKDKGGKQKTTRTRLKSCEQVFEDRGKGDGLQDKGLMVNGSELVNYGKREITDYYGLFFCYGNNGEEGYDDICTFRDESLERKFEGACKKSDALESEGEKFSVDHTCLDKQ